VTGLTYITATHTIFFGMSFIQFFEVSERTKEKTVTELQSIVQMCSLASTIISRKCYFKLLNTA